MKKNFLVLLPILFGFFVMGFCDVVGISSNYVQQDFQLSDTMAGFLPSMLFLWFFIFSVPVGLMMGKIGRKNTVMLSMVLTFVALIIPFVSYSYVSCLIAFSVLGIGNTVLQVSLNPLISNLVSGKLLTSTLTAGQFVKAISSFCGPVIAAWAAVSMGNWKLIFPIFAAITLLASAWLLFTPVPAEQASEKAPSFGDAFSLLKDRTILLLFLGILFVVGLDVGMNVVTPKLLMERCGLTLGEAGYGTSLYFIARTAGAFIGAFFLARYSSVSFFRVSMVVAIAALAVMAMSSDQWTILAAVAVIGFACANVFSIIFSAALQRCANKGNEVSGLMIMGVSGGAIFPLLMGVASEAVGSQMGSAMVLLVCLAYLMVCSLVIKVGK